TLRQLSSPCAGVKGTTIAVSKKQNGEATFQRNSAMLRTPAARRCEASETRKRFEPAARERGRASIGVRASGKPWLRPNELSEKDLSSSASKYTLPPRARTHGQEQNLDAVGVLGVRGVCLQS